MKQIFKKILIAIILIIFISESIFLGVIVYDWNLKKNELERWEGLKFEKLNFVENYQINNEKTDLDLINEVSESPKDIDDVFVSGWIPDWDFADGFQAVKDQSDTFGSISPFWFEIEPDGSLKTNQHTNNPELLKFVKDNDIELIPSITGFDAYTLSIVLNDPKNLDRHVSSIVNQVVANKYDGIDLDYESLYLKDNQKFFEFLRKLSSELIKNDKKLVFTALPKWGDKDVVYLAFPETRKNFDYKKIADLVDELRVMTYEYSGKTNKYYGPIGPLKWQEDVIKYAIASGVPREKIVLGVHTYSFDYTEREKLAEISYYPVLGTEFDGNKPAALAYYNTSVEKIQNERKFTTEFDEEWGEAIGRYVDDSGTNRILVYPNQRSLDMRKELAAKYGIKGVAYWRIGDEGSLRY